MNYLLQPPHQDDSTRDDEEAKNDFWTITGEFVYRHHAERRIISYSNAVHRRYQNNTYVTSCIVEKQIDDYWNVHGRRELSDAWTGFKRFLVLNERPPEGYTWSGVRLTMKQTTSRPDDVWPDMWKHVSDAPKREEKQKVGYRETKAR